MPKSKSKKASKKPTNVKPEFVITKRFLLEFIEDLEDTAITYGACLQDESSEDDLDDLMQAQDDFERASDKMRRVAGMLFEDE